MQNRDKSLKDLRPAIPVLIEENVTSESERFQNTILRPILKLQNELLLKIFDKYIQKRKNQFHQLSATKKLEYIQFNIRNDLKFRNLLMGLVIGHFTLEEYETYQLNQNELNRRIISLITQRIQSQVSEFSIVT